LAKNSETDRPSTPALATGPKLRSKSAMSEIATGACCGPCGSGPTKAVIEVAAPAMLGAIMAFP
jgi:hypothetical protein